MIRSLFAQDLSFFESKLEMIIEFSNEIFLKKKKNSTQKKIF